jgi:uncharacterized protein (DUF362 family)
MDRRLFLRSSAAIGGVVLTSRLTNASDVVGRLTDPLPDPSHSAWWPSAPGQVSFVKTRDRAAGAKKALDLIDFDSPKGKSLFLKPNFNSAHATPGSSHNDTMAALVRYMDAAGADRITLGDRSGMGSTRKVMEDKDVFALADELGIETMVFDELEADDFEMIQPETSHWKEGFAFPREFLAADGVIQTCCLKTHQYGGHFTLSLKNSVGLAAKTVPGSDYSYMRELHSSPDMRRMIAELNTAYAPDVIVLDGVEAFVNGGPHEGKRVDAEVVLASTDRIALDAVGVALLRHYGTTPEVADGKIFDLEQIARAAELGLGVTAPDQIEIITDDMESANYAETIREVLLA